MKKITTTFTIFVTLLFIGNNIHAQAFQKGNSNIDVGIGFGAYGTKQVSRISDGTNTIESDTTDGAASSIFNFDYEYGISNKFGIGARLGFDNYIIADEDKPNLQSVRGVDFAIIANYHLLNSDKNDLMLSLVLGGSSIKWNYTSSIFNPLQSAKGTGSYLSLGLKDRIFFSDHIGIIFNLNYTGYSYKNIEGEFTNTFAALFGSNSIKWDWDWSMKGVNIGTGLAIKF